MLKHLLRNYCADQSQIFMWSLLARWVGRQGSVGPAQPFFTSGGPQTGIWSTKMKVKEDMDERAKQKVRIMVFAFARKNWISWSPKGVSLMLIRLNVFVYKTPKIDTNHRNIRSVGRNINIFSCRRVLLPKNKWIIQDIHVLNEKYYEFWSLI